MTRARKKKSRGAKRDYGCYAKRYEPCAGTLGGGCRNCGRIITTALLEKGDAVCR